jgi:hypothetical protein
MKFSKKKSKGLFLSQRVTVSVISLMKMVEVGKITLREAGERTGVSCRQV